MMLSEHLIRDQPYGHEVWALIWAHYSNSWLYHLPSVPICTLLSGRGAVSNVWLLSALCSNWSEQLAVSILVTAVFLQLVCREAPLPTQHTRCSLCYVCSARGPSFVGRKTWPLIGYFQEIRWEGTGWRERWHEIGMRVCWFGERVLGSWLQIARLRSWKRGHLRGHYGHSFIGTPGPHTLKKSMLDVCDLMTLELSYMCRAIQY